MGGANKMNITPKNKTNAVITKRPWLSTLFLMFITFQLMLVFQNCSQPVSFKATAGETSKSSTDEDDLQLDPPTAQIGFSTALVFTASGGVTPYSFSQMGAGGGGTLTPGSDGTTVSFRSGTQAGNVIVTVTDADGRTVTSNVVVQDSAGSTLGSIQGLVSNAVNGAALAGVRASR